MKVVLFDEKIYLVNGRRPSNKIVDEHLLLTFLEHFLVIFFKAWLDANIFNKSNKCVMGLGSWVGWKFFFAITKYKSLTHFFFKCSILNDLKAIHIV